MHIIQMCILYCFLAYFRVSIRSKRSHFFFVTFMRFFLLYARWACSALHDCARECPVFFSVAFFISILYCFCRIWIIYIQFSSQPHEFISFDATSSKPLPIQLRRFGQSFSLCERTLSDRYCFWSKIAIYWTRKSKKTYCLKYSYEFLVISLLNELSFCIQLWRLKHLCKDRAAQMLNGGSSEKKKKKKKNVAKHLA